MLAGFFFPEKFQIIMDPLLLSSSSLLLFLIGFSNFVFIS